MKKIISCILCTILLYSCSKPSEQIVVATAANVQYVMEEIKVAFEQETGKEVEIIVSSSGKLTAQIQQGAPYDIFVSADTKYPEEIYKNGGSDEAPKIYASGQLVLWAMKIPKSDLALDQLQSNMIKKIAIPNPKFAPYGEAALDVLKKNPQFASVESKLVYGESISQTAQYITTGAAEVGFNALSMVLSPEMKTKGNWILIDSSLYAPIHQAAILLKHSKTSIKRQSSKDFYDFLYSEKAKEIFKKYGYHS
jgi:molybdate transport system substrate-binding protein